MDHENKPLKFIIKQMLFSNKSIKNMQKNLIAKHINIIERYF